MDMDLYAELHGVLQGIVDTASYSLFFTFQPIAAPAAKKGQEHGGNSLNITPVNQSCKSVHALYNQLSAHASSQRARNCSRVDG